MSMRLLEKVNLEHEVLFLQARKQEKEEKETHTKYFPKLQLTDEDIFYTGGGSGKARIIPYWYD